MMVRKQIENWLLRFDFARLQVQNSWNPVLYRLVNAVAKIAFIAEDYIFIWFHIYGLMYDSFHVSFQPLMQL